MKTSKYILSGAVLLVAGVLVFKNLSPQTSKPGIAADKGGVESIAPKPEATRKGGAESRSQADAGDKEAERARRLKESQENRALREEIEQCIADATKLFKKRDIEGALKILDHADDIGGPNGNVLNLRGSCYVETREFDKALPDFQKAAELAKGSPLVSFNIGEVYFVTKRWQEALDVFVMLKEKLPPENTDVGRLLEFKILLCYNKLGRTDEVTALAGKYNDGDASPFYFYAQALVASEADDQQRETQLLVVASQKFPDKRVLDPWRDTMNEYRRPTP